MNRKDRIFVKTKYRHLPYGVNVEQPQSDRSVGVIVVLVILAAILGLTFVALR
jgi:hypothetical protein